MNRTEERKTDHLRICLEEDVEARNVTTGFEDVNLIHRALPEVNRDEIDLTTSLFNYRFSAPIIVEGMTGGTAEALKINASIAEAVEDLGLGMGVGSQRAAIEDPTLEDTFKIAREKAPKAFLMANLGGPQLLRRDYTEIAERIINMIKADALTIHLNPLQEAVQPEGETNYRGILKRITKIVEAVNVPVIVKETGAGIAAEEAKMLERAGVSAIDVAGAGGTSWAAVEYHRAKKHGNHLAESLGMSLWDWGIPTAISLIEVVESVDIPVIASGGIRSGEDAAKALALGASLVGFASPILGPALKGPKSVKSYLNLMITHLRNVMFLVGASSIENLRGVPLVITGRTAEWLRVRGFNPESYAKRRIK